MQEIKFHCRKCRKSMGIIYPVTGNKEAMVLPSIMIKCPVCRKVSTLKKITEGQVTANADNEGRVFI